MENLGRMIEYAVYDLGFCSKEFVDLFVQSGVAERFGKGDCSLIAGKSGVELAWVVLSKVGLPGYEKEPFCNEVPTPEYWAGWALAYYQWQTSLSFKEIFDFISIDNIVAMYSPYHEMDITHFVDRLNQRYREVKKTTKLQNIRTRLNLSTEQLSDYSGVSLFEIEQYENWQADINQATAETLVRLSRAMLCKVEDLIELVPCDKANEHTPTETFVNMLRRK